jgi:PAS domain S-box-containing protein
MERLEERGEMFRELVENSGDVTMVTDRDFRIRYISSSIVDLIGQEPMTLLGKTIFDFVGKANAPEWQELLHDFFDKKNLEISLTIPVSRQKRFFMAYVSNLLNDQHVKGLIVKLHDITDIKNREQYLLESNQHLDQIFYKTTHDLKAPIRSALGLINLAEQGTEEQRKEYLTLIKKSLSKLDTFIEEMNDFFKGDRLEIKRERISLKALLHDEVENLRNLHETGRIKIEIEVNERIDFYSDLFRIKTIVTNLISNAIKYSDLNKKWPYIRIEVLVDTKVCVIRIQDNGIGIDGKYQDKIFDRFFRGTNSSYGAGIGLFIVKDTVQRLSGTIDVSSLKDVGTTFSIAIPNQNRGTIL